MERDHMQRGTKTGVVARRDSAIWGSSVSGPSAAVKGVGVSDGYGYGYGDRHYEAEMVDHDGSTVRGERLGRVRASLIRDYRMQWTRRPQSFQRQRRAET
jgi:hypothetical protein